MKKESERDMRERAAISYGFVANADAVREDVKKESKKEIGVRASNGQSSVAARRGA